MDCVQVVSDIQVRVQVDSDAKRYVAEAAIPWTVINAKPSAGTVWSGDMGVTHGDRTKPDTILRTYWNNQATGLVSDEVFELQMVPANWGELRFQ
jgi:hypothetical protein